MIIRKLMLPHMATRAFMSSLSNSSRATPIYFVTNLQKPKKPSMESCCGDGCLHCVWVDYLEKDSQYRYTIAYLQEKIVQGKITGTNFEGVYYTADPEVINQVEQPESGDIEMLKPIKKTPHFFYSVI